MNARSPSDMKGPSLRTRIREATAAAIIDAAEEVFADQGLGKAHMNEIAARAGVAVGTVYNHFKDRDALLTALLIDRRQGMLEVMEQFLELPSSGSFEDDLMALMKMIGGFLDRNKRFHHLLHQCDLPQNLAAYPETAACMPEMKQQMNLLLGKLMRRGLEQKALRPELADYYPALLMGILRSARQQQRDHESGEHLPIEDIVHFFMRGAGT
jgi:AcrR family transcriptional regulator